MSECPSHLRLKNIPLFVQTTFCLSIHPSIDTGVASTFWWTWIMQLWIWVNNYLFELLLLLLWGIYPEVGFFDHMAVLFYIFWGIAKLGFHSSLHFISPQAACKHSNSSTFLPLVMFCFVGFIIAILISMTCYHCGFEGKSFLRVMVELNSGVCTGFEEEKEVRGECRPSVYKKHKYFAFRELVKVVE